MRALFIRYAVNVQLFRCIRHPKTKYLASVHGLFRNFRRARERLGFFKLKKNLNMQLRESMSSYKENDKELFIQLNQILVSSRHQQGGLEGGFAYAVSEIFLYLKNTMQLEHPERGTSTQEWQGGPIDEAILTLRQDLCLPSQGASGSAASQKLKIFLSQFDAAQSSFNKASLHINYDPSLVAS